MFRANQREEALAQFLTLVKDEPDPLRQFMHQMLALTLQFQLGRIGEHQFPNDAIKFIQQYEQLSPAQRERLSQDQFVRATWIYFVMALVDIENGRLGPAMDKLNACLTSPDDFLAADAGYRLGMIHMQQRNFDKAREVFEFILFATRSPESAVRATFALGRCWEELGRPDQAVDRYAQLMDRYPISPLVDQLKTSPVYQKALARLNNRKSETK